MQFPHVCPLRRQLHRVHDGWIAAYVARVGLEVVGGRAHDHDVGGFVDRAEAGVLWAGCVGIGDDGEPVSLEPKVSVRKSDLH